MLERDRWQTRAGKIIFAAAVITAVYIVLKYMLGTILPFLIAWLIATPIATLSKASERRLGGKRRSWAIFYALFFWAAFIIVCVLLIGKISKETADIIAYIAAHREEIGEKISSSANAIIELPAKLPLLNSLDIEGLEEQMGEFIGAALQNIAQKGTELLASGVGRVVVGAPKFFISFLVCAVASVYIAVDRERIINYFASLLNEETRKSAKGFFHRVGRGVRGYARAYGWLLVITFLELYMGFLVLGVKYAFVLAIFIAFFDLLPMFSSAVVLVPWGIIMLIGESYGVGVGFIVLSLIITIVRQIAEPRLIGKGLGIHPLASLVSIYIGFRLFGFFGMLLAPVSVLVLREILQSTKKEEKIEEKT